MLWKVRYRVAGHHVHCDLFVAKQANMTWANCGNFIVDVLELESLRASFSGAQFYEVNSRDTDTGGQK